MRTLFATSTPPVSIAWFHLSPHSRRSISVRKLEPRACLPHGSVPRPWYSQSSTTSMRVSRITSSPTTRNRSPSCFGGFSMRVLRKVICGKRSASKKSEPRRCASRSATPVSMLAASMAASTPAVLRVIPVAREGGLHVFESAAHGGHHHVLHRELDARVRRVELPGRHCDPSGGCGCHRSSVVPRLDAVLNSETAQRLYRVPPFDGQVGS